MANVTIEVDGKSVQVPQGSTVMDAANRIGAYIPHFCYHKKLSIAANCRMCLVQVEKAPKPMPACATPATEGMKVWTHSDQAVNAQKGVMEFLLINHPLDCPICDQGGECQLQDLAVGYGGSNSRYQEAKRVVFHKNVGPLLSMEEMTRCIHCTRCVRFGVEIAGIMELGMSGRGEHSEIHSFVGRTVDSELSGNMIDLCPVGAITSKPFRYTARTWELARRKSIAPHDSLGSNIIVQVKQDRAMRVLPLENEAINECWLSDKDRFSYEALNSPDRLTGPMIRDAEGWKEVDWQTALRHVADQLGAVRGEHGPDAIAALVSPHSTLEEMALTAELVRGLGSDNVEHRLRQSDFRADATRKGAPWLGMPIADVGKLDRILVIGSFLRKDHPLLSARIRAAVKKGAGLSIVHSVDDNLLMPTVAKSIVAPDRLVDALSDIVSALQRRGDATAAAPGADAASEGDRVNPANPSDHGAHGNAALRDDQGAAVNTAGEGDAAAASQRDQVAQHIAGTLGQGKNVGVFVGNFAVHHPDAANIAALGARIAQLCGARFGVLAEAANSVGGYLAQAMPASDAGGKMFDKQRQAFLLVNVEPDLDCADPAAAMNAMRAAKLVVALSPFRHALEYAHVMLPVAPFTETSGTFVNCEGRVQGFNGVVPPLGETRPGWKVLRVLGNLLGLPGFDYETSESVRNKVLGKTFDVSTRLDNSFDGASLRSGTGSDSQSQTDAHPDGNTLQRIAEVPIYNADPIVRRAPSLQHTADARMASRVIVHPDTAARLGLDTGDRARVRQGSGEAILTLAVDPRMPPDCARVPAALASTAALGPMNGRVSLERA